MLLLSNHLANSLKSTVLSPFSSNLLKRYSISSRVKLLSIYKIIWENYFMSIQLQVVRPNLLKIVAISILHREIFCLMLLMINMALFSSYALFKTLSLKHPWNRGCWQISIHEIRSDSFIFNPLSIKSFEFSETSLPLN